MLMVIARHDWVAVLEALHSGRCRGAYRRGERGPQRDANRRRPVIRSMIARRATEEPP